MPVGSDGPEDHVSNRPSPPGRLERRAEREARKLDSSGPRARRQRQVATRRVDSGGPKFLPGFIRNASFTTVAVVIGTLLLGAGLVYAVTQTGGGEETPGWQKAQLDDDPGIPGQYIAPHPGADGVAGSGDDRQHFATGQKVPICTAEQLTANQVSEPLCYHSNPPTSGPHADQPMPFRVLENPAPKENLIHSMEHGGIIIWYNTSNQDVINQLKSLTQDQIDRRRFVALTVYTEMEPDTIAVTSWTRLDKFPVSDFERKRITDFINENHKRFNPEGF
jgi:hypothetical protein